MKKVKAGLGTVQLGLPYGNKKHQQIMAKEEAFEILGLAYSSGIIFYDTASAYGESESRIGEWLCQKNPKGIEVSTKIPIVDETIWRSYSAYKNYVEDSLQKSLQRLSKNSFGLLQFHQSDCQFLSAKSVQSVMSELLESNICKTIGVSVYSEDEAEVALSLDHIQTLQIPVNLVDHRFVSKTFLEKYKQRNISLIVRSILLQGILCDNAPLPHVKMQDDLAVLRNLCIVGSENLNLKLEVVAFKFVFETLRNQFDVGLLGVDSLSTLQNNLELLDGMKHSPEISFSEIEHNFKNALDFCKQKKLYNPSFWNA